MIYPSEPTLQFGNSSVDVVLFLNAHVFVIPMHDLKDLCMLKACDAIPADSVQESPALFNTKDHFQGGETGPCIDKLL